MPLLPWAMVKGWGRQLSRGRWGQGRRTCSSAENFALLACLVDSTLPPTHAMLAITEASLLECCASRAWAAGVAARAPFPDLDSLVAAAREAWWHEVRCWGARWRARGESAAACAADAPPAAAPPCSPPQTPVVGWLEAFAAHPKIGDLEGLKRKYGAFADLSKGEQAAAEGAAPETLQVGRRGGGGGGGGRCVCEGVAGLAAGLGWTAGGRWARAAARRARERPRDAAPHTPARPPIPRTPQKQALADWNARYEARFGHIFIVCASGKSAEEMLAAVQSRCAGGRRGGAGGGSSLALSVARHSLAPSPLARAPAALSCVEVLPPSSSSSPSLPRPTPCSPLHLALPPTTTLPRGIGALKNAITPAQGQGTGGARQGVAEVVVFCGGRGGQRGSGKVRQAGVGQQQAAAGAGQRQAGR